MKYWIFAFCLGLSITLNAQKVKLDDKTYEVKGEQIFKNGKDVTNALSLEERDRVKKAFEAKKIEIAEEKKQKVLEKKEKAEKKGEKAVKDAEKAEKKEIKKRKKAEKALKNEQKIQASYNKAKDNLSKAKVKYEKLKSQGKLSPVDDAKWQKKLGKLNGKVSKTESKLKS